MTVTFLGERKTAQGRSKRYTIANATGATSFTEEPGASLRIVIEAALAAAIGVTEVPAEVETDPLYSTYSITNQAANSVRTLELTYAPPFTPDPPTF
jgi:hypothetical protein